MHDNKNSMSGLLSELEALYNNALLLGYTSIEYEDLLIAKSDSGRWIFTGLKDNRITYIEIPDFIEEIGAKALASCHNLKSVQLPQHLKKINYRAFSQCSNLKHIDFPEELEVIGSAAFEASGLTEIYLPDNIKTVGDYAFIHCFNTRHLSIPSGISLGYGCFLGVGKFLEANDIEFIIRPGLHNDIEKTIGPYAIENSKGAFNGAFFDSYYNWKVKIIEESYLVIA